MLRANGDRVIEGATLCNLSDVALMRGDDALALALARSALDILVADAGARPGGGCAAQAGPGRTGAGATAPQRARPSSRCGGRALEIESPWQHDAVAGLAQVALAEGDGRDGASRDGGGAGACSARRHARRHGEAAPDRADLPPGARPSPRLRATEWLTRAQDALRPRPRPSPIRAAPGLPAATFRTTARSSRPPTRCSGRARDEEEAPGSPLDRRQAQRTRLPYDRCIVRASLGT